MARYNSKVTTVTFEDGTTPTALSITAGPGPGDLTIGETNAENAELIRVMDRGTFDGHVEGDDLEQEWSLTIGLRDETITEAAADRIRDFIVKAGNFSAAISTGPDPDIHTFKMIVEMVRNGKTSTITLPVCAARMAFAEAVEGNTLAVSGTNNGAWTVTSATA